MAYAGWACTDLLNGENIPTACVQATGPGAAGVSCAFNAQCQSGFCAIAPASACGVCAAAPKAGDSCANLTGCGQGLLLHERHADLRDRRRDGRQVWQGSPVRSGPLCVGANATAGTMGTCQTAVSMQGAACDAAAKTGPACDRDMGLTCNSTSKQCEPLAVVGGGQPCGDVNSQGVACGSAGVCTGAMGTTAGTCTAAVADGATCSTPGLHGCETLSRCIVAGEGGTTGTCAMQTATACH